MTYGIGPLGHSQAFRYGQHDLLDVQSPLLNIDIGGARSQAQGAVRLNVGQHVEKANLLIAVVTHAVQHVKRVGTTRQRSGERRGPVHLLASGPQVEWCRLTRRGTAGPEVVVARRKPEVGTD